VELTAERIAGEELDFSQQQFNTNSTTIQQPENVEWKENESIVDVVKDTKNQPVSQHTPREEGERGGVEQTQLGDILQIAPSEEKQSVGTQTKSLPQGGDEQAAFQVGDRIIDVLTTIRGTVVAVEGEKVIFHCRAMTQLHPTIALFLGLGIEVLESVWLELPAQNVCQLLYCNSKAGGA
jgi:hypothetical protein